MIGRGEITKQAQRDGVDAQTVERDYILAHAALDLASIAGQHMILKGGTSLRLAHYDDYRYSADLDYSLLGITTTDALDYIGDALGRCRARIEWTCSSSTPLPIRPASPKSARWERSLKPSSSTWPTTNSSWNMPSSL